MENMKLDLGRALQKLGNTSRHIDLGNFEEIAAYETEDRYRRNGFAKLVHRGNYLYTSTHDNHNTHEHTG
jgi:hypothetical protein